MRHLFALCAIVWAAGWWAAPAWALAPFLDPIYGVSVTPNLEYGTGAVNNGLGIKSLRLDLYRPVSLGAPVPVEAPAIILIHGGGFIGGDRLQLALLANAYASYGYTVAAISYRLYFDFPPNSSPGPADNFTPPPPGYDTFADLQLGGNAINAAVQDGRAALAWMKSNGATYGFDPDRIAVGGASAGAITSLLMAYNDPPPGLRPTAVLDFFGGMYGTENVIQPGAPPAFIYHGTADTQVPFAGDQAVADRLAAVGTYHEFYVGQGLGHVLDVPTFNVMYDGQTLLRRNIDFLYNQLVVPEPSTFALAALGVLGVMAHLSSLGRKRIARGLRVMLGPLLGEGVPPNSV